VQVVYGFIALKTHAKISLVVRREGGHLRTYCHFGTGNYHPETAQDLYRPVSVQRRSGAWPRCGAAFQLHHRLCRARRAGEDADVAARHARQLIEDRRRIAHARRPSRAIWVKLNSLVDPGIIDGSTASQAGRPDRPVVRGICCLRPGVPAFGQYPSQEPSSAASWSMAASSASGVDTRLPSRKPKVYISLGRLDAANLDRRVETLVPVRESQVHQQIQTRSWLPAERQCQPGTCTLTEPIRAIPASVRADAFSRHTYCMDESLPCPAVAGR
jgi:polyphosphate kinase